MEVVSALRKAHVGVQEASVEGKPQLCCREPWVPHAGQIPGPQAVLGGWHTALGSRGLPQPWPLQADIPSSLSPREKPGPRVALSPQKGIFIGSGFQCRLAVYSEWGGQCSEWCGKGL